MNYFTKEWYELCQKTSAHFGLEEDEKAEFFSEEYFQELYNQRLNELILEEVIAKHEIVKVKGVYIEHKPLDSKKVAEDFKQSLVHNQEHIKNILPEQILGRIADIRVFVLRKATRQVIKDMTHYCQENRKLTMKTIEDYQKYYKNALESLDKSVVERINFHDCTVIGIEQTENALTLLFDNSGGFTNITKMHLKNYEIVKQDALLQNSWWLYHEIYKTNGKYELHVLLLKKDKSLTEGLIEFTVSAEHISFEH